MKIKLYFTIIILIISITLKAQSIRVKFQVEQASINVAEGTTSLTPVFIIVPSTFNDSDIVNPIDLIDFPMLNYANINQVVIEQLDLSNGGKQTFSRIASFQKNDTIIYGAIPVVDFIKGATYIFRLAIITNSGEQINLLNENAKVDLGNPYINCAKFNNTYRKACHNCFQQNVISNLDFSSTPLFSSGLKKALNYTRVIELDIHTPSLFPSLFPGVWNVRHTGFGNNNNCGIAGDNPFNVCLDDVEEWHNQNPNHDPIIVFIDLKSDFISPSHTPLLLDALLIQKFGFAEIYKPKDLLGNQADISFMARLNNLPSMGDLTGKFIFVLTGPASRINQYYSHHLQAGTQGVAFAAVSVKNIAEADNVQGVFNLFKKNIIFFNIKKSNDLNIGLHVSSKGYMSREWESNGFFSTNPFGPKNFNNGAYRQGIDFNINNIAVRNIWKHFYTSGRDQNGIQYIPAVTFPGVVNNHIYSTYQNVTQAAIFNIVATDLTVEPGAHYRMIAGNSIDLQNNVDIKAGSDVDIRIDNCWDTDYSQRQQQGEQLTQEEIDALMHELDKELYGYTPKDEEEIVSLTVYPNPTNDIVNISYTNYLLKEAILTLYDITGRMVKTKKYVPQHTGNQQFSIDVTNLKAGTYFYTLQVGERSYNGKVVKMGY